MNLMCLFGPIICMWWAESPGVRIIQHLGWWVGDIWGDALENDNHTSWTLQNPHYKEMELYITAMNGNFWEDEKPPETFCIISFFM